MSSIRELAWTGDCGFGDADKDVYGVESPAWLDVGSDCQVAILDTDTSLARCDGSCAVYDILTGCLGIQVSRIQLRNFKGRSKCGQSGQEAHQRDFDTHGDHFRSEDELKW